MNPSYNDSFGGASSGGMNPNGGEVPVNPVAGDAAAGVPVGSQAQANFAMPNSLAPVQPSVNQNPMMPTQPNPMMNSGMMQPMPMNMDSGDIVLAGAEKKKPKLGAIILVVALILLAVIVAGVVIAQRIGGGSGSTANLSDAQKAFNSYVNYVMWGKESDEEVNMDEVDGNTLYYLKLSGGELDQYLLKVQDLYDILNSSYSSTGEMTDISALNVFFHDYVAMLPLTIEEIGEEYALRGKEATQDLIDERYNKNKATGILLSDYIGKEKELLELYMRIVMDANNSGCVEISALNKGCYSLTKEELGAVETKLFDLTNIQDSMYFSAMETLRYIYDDIINMEGQDG